LIDDLNAAGEAEAQKPVKKVVPPPPSKLLGKTVKK
jgi:hypothetical protein